MKSIFASKTFWLNILGIAASVGNIVPPKIGMSILAVVNIVNRFLTNQPVSLFGGQ